MPFDNPSFEAPGALPGQASGWLMRSSISTRWRAGWREENAFDPVAAPNDFSAGSWASTNVTVVTDGSTAPDGTSTADQLRATALNARHVVMEAATRDFVEGRTYTFGALFKKTNALQPNAGLRVTDGTDVWLAKLGLSTVATSSSNKIRAVSPPSGNVAAISVHTMLLPSGWTLAAFSFMAAADFTGTLGVAVYSDTTTLTETFTGANNGPYVWGAFAYEGPLHDSEAFDWAEANTVIVGGVNALFDDGTVTPRIYDSFEYGWGQPYFTTLPGGVQALWNAGSAFESTDESFEHEWWSDQQVLTELPITATPATFSEDMNPFEDFGTGWVGPVGDVDYATTLPDSVKVACTWAYLDGVVDTAESFERVLDDVLVTVDASGNIFTAVAHNIPTESPVGVIAPDGAVPYPLVERVATYWTRDTTVDTFRLALTLGGTAIDLTDTGNGAIYVRGSASVFWNGPELLYL